MATREQKLDAIGRMWFLPEQEKRRLIAEAWGLDVPTNEEETP